MAELGRFALLLALFWSGYAIIADLMGAWRKDPGLIKSGRNATIAALACLCASVAVLLILLVKSDFSVTYVIEHSSNALPLAYKISALWAGASGSLLFWLWLQVGIVVIVFCRPKPHEIIFSASARAFSNIVSIFFLIILVMDKNPFAISVVTAEDGSGLNPLLQHPAMAIHPPTLFIGYAAFIIPFAWAIVAMVYDSKESVLPYFHQMRRWILWAWLFLTVGIVLGAWWAYEELGWGGYWAWDPVENASLLPWLTATALLHCSRTYKRNTPIALWLIILSLVSYSLCIFGTFLTRYGLVSSVHAYTEKGLGLLFIALLVIIWLITAVFLWRGFRKKTIQTNASVGPGHKFIIINNWLLVVLTFVILIGTLFPFLSGLVSERQISLKPDYFTKITSPAGLFLVLLLAVCPALLRDGIKKNLRTIGSAVTAVLALAGWFFTKSLAAACFILCAFALINLAADYINRYRKQRGKNQKQSPARINLRWHGTRLVHLGVVLVFIGIAGSGGYDVEEKLAFEQGQQKTVAGFDITYEGLVADHGPNYTTVSANITIHKDGREIAKLTPSQAFYTTQDKSTKEVDIKRTLAYDLYVALEEFDSSTQLINLIVLVKPLINWIWIGSMISMLGTTLVLVALYRRKTSA
jgi:cytochrome c-type biogenesis protein CcmF